MKSQIELVLDTQCRNTVLINLIYLCRSAFVNQMVFIVEMIILELFLIMYRFPHTGGTH